MKKIVFLILILGLEVASTEAAVHYASNAAQGNSDGSSWTNTWNLTSIPATSLAAGDIVYIDGGSPSKTYSGVSSWKPKGGTAGNPIIYRTGQDANHNGTVIFQGSGGAWIAGPLSGVYIDGNVGGVRQMTVQGYTSSDAVIDLPSNGSNLRFSYINFLNMGGDFHFVNSSGIELDHNYIYKVQSTHSDPTHDFIGYGMGGGAYDVNKIHDNQIHLPARSSDSAWGADGFQWPSGTSFYNNYFRIYLTNYTNTQHADIFQTKGSYVKIYNNVFDGVPESVLYYDQVDASNIHDVMVYNNLIMQSAEVQPSVHVNRGFDIQPEQSGGGTATFTDVVIANNTFVDQSSLFSIRWNNFSPAQTGCTRCTLANNAFVNSAGMSNDTDMSKFTGSATNVSVPTSSLVSYSLRNNTEAGVHLKGTDTVALDRGMTLSQFSVDKDGNTRPHGAAWDIGAYEYGGVVTPINGACGGTLNACSAGSLVDVPDNATQYLWQCAGANGGSTANCSLTRPTPPNVGNGTQVNVQLDTPFDFNLTDPGTYKLIGTITTGGLSSNSIYLDIDHNPGSGNGTGENDKTWDMDYPLTGAARDAAWRGVLSITPACQADPVQGCDQYNPKTWDLTAGLHTLYLNTREGGVQLTSIKFVKVVVTPPSATHPGDSDADSHMTLNEATQYGFCWKSAPTVPTGCPAGADLNNSTRAGLLYGSTVDGIYHYDSTKTPPACWMPGP